MPGLDLNGAPATGDVELQAVKNRLAIDNLERLSLYEVPENPNDNLEVDGPLVYMLEKWTRRSKNAIDWAVTQQVHGSDKIDWRISMLPFLESMAMYCRDWELFRAAWSTYRNYKLREEVPESEKELAVMLYLAANRHIDKLAKLWGLEFLIVCDLVGSTPEGHNNWAGPFCGAFYKPDDAKGGAFIGLAFKGTSPYRLKEIGVDVDYDLTSPGEYLGNKRVSQGAFGSLFGAYEGQGKLYDLVRHKLSDLAKTLKTDSSRPVFVHVTGHSLGGSFSQLLYAQLLIDYKDICDPFVMGDQYTFGAPRVGCQAWALMNQELAGSSQGHSWRIANEDDPVPRMPPTTLKKKETDFCHIGPAYLISGSDSPLLLGSEIGMNPPPLYPLKNLLDFIKVLTRSVAHLPHAYYYALSTAIERQESVKTDYLIEEMRMLLSSYERRTDRFGTETAVSVKPFFTNFTNGVDRKATYV